MAEQTILITKASGEKEAFDIQKLEHSLKQAQASPGSIQAVTSHILQELEEGMSTHEIYRHAFELLHKVEKRVALRYSLKRALLDLGPSGFPFEKFVAEIFRGQGYDAVTDQVVYGGCVEHEVDVVAWKNNKLIMSEVKFHNQLGLKSDLKVVLYVKARFDDLHKGLFNYGGHETTLSEGWLITNTKFTISAVRYAECQNLRIVGWNYPLDGNLHDMIESTGVHPLTSLHSLSEHDKKTLIQQGVVLCKTLQKDKTILKNLGLSEANIEAINEEISFITGSSQQAPVSAAQ
jgi:hypothetical protein